MNEPAISPHGEAAPFNSQAVDSATRLAPLSGVQRVDLLARRAKYGTDDWKRLLRLETRNDALEWLSFSFDLPISFEQPILSVAPYTVYGFEVAANQTLKTALDEFCEKSKTPMRWEIIQSTLCILPIPPDSRRTLKPGERSFLDVRVSLDLDEVSTWEAMKAFGEAINAQLVGIGGKVRVLPRSVVRGHHPVPELTETRSVSVHIQDISAREAACVIASTSPLPVSWNYRQEPEEMRGYFYVVVYKNGSPVEGPLAIPGELHQFSERPKE